MLFLLQEIFFQTTVSKASSKISIHQGIPTVNWFWRSSSTRSVFHFRLYLQSRSGSKNSPFDQLWHSHELVIVFGVFEYFYMVKIPMNWGCTFFWRYCKIKTLIHKYIVKYKHYHHTSNWNLQIELYKKSPFLASQKRLQYSITLHSYSESISINVLRYGIYNPILICI